MSRTITLNGKLYPAKDMDFNMICELEEQGISLEEIEKKPMSMMRFYIAYCIGGTKESAGKIIEEHLENGGDFADIANAMGEAMDNSGFFRSLTKRTEKKTSTTKSKKEKTVANIEQ